MIDSAVSSAHLYCSRFTVCSIISSASVISDLLFIHSVYFIILSISKLHSLQIYNRPTCMHSVYIYFVGFKISFIWDLQPNVHIIPVHNFLFSVMPCGSVLYQMNVNQVYDYFFSVNSCMQEIMGFLEKISRENQESLCRQESLTCLFQRWTQSKKKYIYMHCIP